MRRIHYVINARIPHVRAYGIQIAKMCEALVESGITIVPIVPATSRARTLTMREENNLRVDIPLVSLPGFDWYDRGRFPMVCGSVIFMLSSFVYLLIERLRGRLEIIYTIDMDTFSYALLPLLGVPVVVELHGAKKPSLINQFFLRRVSLIVATNTEIRDALRKTYALPPEIFIVEPNGVDVAAYQDLPDRAVARKALQIPQDARVALYAGRLYKWKGLSILTESARIAPDIAWYVVGGSRDDFQKVTELSVLPDNLHIMDDQPEREVPRWLAAADALLIVGTARNELSFRYTSPMKVYEYLAASRPVVAAATPALKSAEIEECTLFYEPDDAVSLVAAVQRAIEKGSETERMRAHGRDLVARHTWGKRAERIMARISAL